MKPKVNRDSKLLFKYSMSVASSWAWGVSLVVGMTLIQTKGLIPFVIWAAANSLALPLFGLIAYRIPNLHKVVNSKPITLFTTLVCIFCMWIQLNAIFQYIGKVGFVDDGVAKLLTVVVVLPLVFILLHDGLNRLIRFDKPAWSSVYLILFLLLLYGLLSGMNRIEVPLLSNSDDVLWAINSIFILFSGPIMFIKNWQMAEKLKVENMMHAHYWAGGLFAVYMALVGMLGSFEFTGLSNIVLLIAITFIALTTADAAILGMHRLLGKKIGTVISLASLASWVFVIPMGVMGLWTTMGDARKWVALICIIIAFAIHYKSKQASDNQMTNKRS